MLTHVDRNSTATDVWLWVGLAIGGNMIAASARFQMDSLSTAQRLLMGRAQFGWLGMAKIAFTAILSQKMGRILISIEPN